MCGIKRKIYDLDNLVQQIYDKAIKIFVGKYWKMETSKKKSLK
jgi:hypothetical protein